MSLSISKCTQIQHRINKGMCQLMLKWSIYLKSGEEINRGDQLGSYISEAHIHINVSYNE
jgi:hypothetical protein